MATVLYINADSKAGPPRATSLGCGWMPAVPPQFASQVPSLPAVILAGQGAITVIPDSPPTTQAAVASALAPILAAEQAAAAATAGQFTNTATLQAALDARLATIEAFITANPGGAVLTGPQTLVVAKMLAGLVRLLRNNVNTIGQAG